MPHSEEVPPVEATETKVGPGEESGELVHNSCTPIGGFDLSADHGPISNKARLRSY